MSDGPGAVAMGNCWPLRPLQSNRQTGAEMKIDIAKVLLKMDSHEQWLWVCSYAPENNKGYTESLADLAFRLRDEVDEAEYSDALLTIHRIVNGESDCSFLRWVESRIKPIEMILAALKAKELTHE